MQETRFKLHMSLNYTKIPVQYVFSRVVLALKDVEVIELVPFHPYTCYFNSKLIYHGLRYSFWYPQDVTVSIT